MVEMLDLFQTTFLLNAASNGANLIWASQQALLGYLNTYLNGGADPNGGQFAGVLPTLKDQLLGQDWEVVWGPSLCTLSPYTDGYAQNSMYVARSRSNKVYVVAIAGTNATSPLNWVIQDFAVDPSYMAAWPITSFAAPAWHAPYTDQPAISQATLNGLGSLLGLRDPGAGQLLADFLKAAAAPDQRVIFSGHSLGGALSPTLALYLYPNPSNSGWAEVLTLPSAGASPGNTAFAKLFAAAFPAKPASGDHGWNMDLMNRRDEIPYMWNLTAQVVGKQNAWGNYPSIYGALDYYLGRSLRNLMGSISQFVAPGGYMNLPHAPFSTDWGYWAWAPDLNNPGQWAYPPTWTSLPLPTDAAPLSSLGFPAAFGIAHQDQYSYAVAGMALPRMRLPYEPLSMSMRPVTPPDQEPMRAG
jgi:hypothetical protein